MKTKHYVPLVIAKRLKEKGYHRDRYADNEMAWPTYEQAVDWIDRQSGILISTIAISDVEKPDNAKYYGAICPSRGYSSIVTSEEPTKEQALNIAIIKALEKI